MNEDRLYNLLPALYRQRDVTQGEPLRALMSVLESQLKELETDIGAGYNNWFVETCDDWVLPYLADLVGMTSLSQERHVFSTQRRQVANTIGYRCRKGTIATLEHVVRDATGWLACAVELDRRLAVTHHLARMPGALGRTVDVRRTAALAELGGPFDELAHTAEVCGKPPASADAKTLRSRRYGVGRLGIFFWRLRSFRMANSRPHSIAIPRLLDFLNRARGADEIVRRIVDDPEFGRRSERAYGVRPTLAQRILKERDRLPGHRFESLQQVDEVEGVGADTLHDMLASFAGLYTFHPLGVDMRLFNRPQYIAEIDQRARAAHMPFALTRLQLEADLQEYEARFGDWPEEIRPPSSRFYGPDRGLNVALWRRDSAELEPTSIPPIRVLSTDLSQWDEALADQVLEKYPGKEVAIDVQLGLLAVLPHKPKKPGNETPPNEKSDRERKPPVYYKDIRVTYCYGFGMPMGGGPYHRDLRRLYSVKVPFHVDFHIDVKGAAGNGTATEAEGQTIPPDCVPTLSQALDHWHKHQDKMRHGVIRILDNERYDEKLTIKLNEGSQLTIVADNGTRPVIGNNEPLTVVCEGKGSEEKRQLDLSGLLIHGGLQIQPLKQAGAMGGLAVTIKHCTLVTSEDRRLKAAAIRVEPAEEQAQSLDLSIESSIVGPLVLPETMANLKVINSIVDSESEYAIAADEKGAKPGPTVNLERATIFGQVHARKVVASEVIFTGALKTSALKASGPETQDEIQHSYVPPASTTGEGQPHPDISTDVAAPRFTSTRYGDPGYAQLSLDCPREIRGGGTDGSEMGAFHDLYQPQAEENVREVLDEYLPLGLQASIHYVT